MNSYLISFLLGPAAAHMPSFTDGAHDTPLSAFRILDPDLSIVVYRDVSCDTPTFWMTYEAESDYPLFFQVGVPQIDRLSGYRPSIALLHPDLPAPTEPLPFEVPEGLGIEIFHSDDVDEPDSFFEPFTQTSSWIWIEETVPLPADGQGYLVSWVPSGWTGKMWVAVGTIEDFSNVDWSEAAEWDESVNDFHETGEYAPRPDTEEQDCAGASGEDLDADDGAGQTDSSPDEQAANCSHIPLANAFLAGLGALLLQGRRRRSTPH